MSVSVSVSRVVNSIDIYPSVSEQVSESHRDPLMSVGKSMSHAKIYFSVSVQVSV